jgi:ADP-ribose pyrophosphatase YjhB (NUDIX family)
LEFGEGTRDCLKREFAEETGLAVTVGEHLYTTDFFQISAFNNVDQIICIYYLVHAVEPINLTAKTAVFDFEPNQVADATTSCEVSRWLEWKYLNEDSLTLPIDKVVAKILKESY